MQPLANVIDEGQNPPEIVEALPVLIPALLLSRLATRVTEMAPVQGRSSCRAFNVRLEVNYVVLPRSSLIGGCSWLAARLVRRALRLRPADFPTMKRRPRRNGGTYHVQFSLHYLAEVLQSLPLPDPPQFGSGRPCWPAVNCGPQRGRRCAGTSCRFGRRLRCMDCFVERHGNASWYI